MLGAEQWRQEGTLQGIQVVPFESGLKDWAHVEHLPFALQLRQSEMLHKKQFPRLTMYGRLQI